MTEQGKAFSDATPAELRGMQTAELSNAMVAIYKEQFGRGPTKAHTVYATDDLLICTLESSLIPSERAMLELDEHQRVREIRMFFQHASEKHFVGMVERITGRQVRAFVSGMDTRQDVATEVFYLEPRAADSASTPAAR
jgi:uncharacterized protein YbcI